MKIQGEGTFVMSVLPVIGLAMKTRFTEEMFGKEVKVKREILFKGIEETPRDVKGYLKTEDRLYQILCRRTIGGEPAYLDASYIPYHMLSNIEKLYLANIFLYPFLQKKAQKKIFKVVQTIEIFQRLGKSAKNLDLMEAVPLLAVHRLFISSDNTPVAYRRMRCRSDRYKFQTEFERIR
jgi:GntR family transcriptional regulator, frlABCD operon transcriptional regulator